MQRWNNSHVIMDINYAHCHVFLWHTFSL